MFKFVKKLILGKNEGASSDFSNKLQEKSKNFLNVAQNKIEEAKDEFFVIKEKMSNLLETNHKLGLKHLERGNISEAIFRFKFIRMFWPHFYEAQYQLAYALCLGNRPFQAKKVLNELIAKDPQIAPRAQELLASIEEVEKEIQE